MVNILKYLPGLFEIPPADISPYDIPFHYTTAILIYNDQLMKKIGIPAPSYTNFKEQREYLRDAFEKIRASGMFYPGISQNFAFIFGKNVQQEMLQDLLAETTDFSQKSVREQYDVLKEIFINKTSKLLTAPLLVASELADKKCYKTLKEFGTNLGIMFQITDDILDVEGDAEAMGKPVGSDAKNQKSTYVSLYSLEGAKALAAKTVDEALQCLEIFGDKADALREITKLMCNRKN